MESLKRHGGLSSFGFVFIFFIGFIVCDGAIPCSPRSYGHGSVVCVCNMTYCDTLDRLNKMPTGVAEVYESSKEGLRFEKKTMNFTLSALPFLHYLSDNISLGKRVMVSINRSDTFQKILGFGGAFTDATGINILNLPSNMQMQILQGYYSDNGSQYTIGRVPMASCDFSTHEYSYDDVPEDLNLEHFNLTKEDFTFKIPLIKIAQSMSSQPIKLFASPWSSPSWMKTNNNMCGKGSLKGEPGGPYYQAWADYFVMFLQAYEQHNITFWGVTAENEPMNGLIADFRFQALGFTPETQRDFIKLNLGPTLQKAGFGSDKIKLMIMDDQRLLLPKWAQVVLSDLETSQYIAGVAFHWYLNFISPVKLLDITHDLYPEKFILSTEACIGSGPLDISHVSLGSWTRAERYAHDIIQDLLHWTVGWVDWNLALDTEGGPNWVKNYVDSPVIVNISAKEFYRQPMYYALAHFSKFILPGSVRIGLIYEEIEGLEMVAFATPENATVVLVVNRLNHAVVLTINDVLVGNITNTVSPHSIQSYIWWSS